MVCFVRERICKIALITLVKEKIVSVQGKRGLKRDRDTLIAGTIRFWRVPKFALIPYYHRFSQTELFGFIFRAIVDNRFVIVDNRFVNDSTENETKKFGLGKPVVIWD